MQIVFFVALFILGLCLGSFLCCQARRLHLKATGEGKLGARSVCLSCGKKLRWFDNIPLISWIVLRGKCRYCHKNIGIAEFLSEIGVACAFLALGTTIDLATADLFAWLIFVVTLCFICILSLLAIYDGLYGELPFKLLILAIVFGFILTLSNFGFILQTETISVSLVLKPLTSVAILGGLYLLLYLFSNGKWVGDGDWLLGVALGFALFDPWLALIALFLANVLACLVMLPSIKKSKHKKIYFGPFLVLAFIITFTFSDFFFYAIGG